MGYQMTKRMFDMMLKTRSKEEKKENPYKFVMRMINEGFGLRGTVTHVTIINE